MEQFDQLQANQRGLWLVAVAVVAFVAAAVDWAKSYCSCLKMNQNAAVKDSN